MKRSWFASLQSYLEQEVRKILRDDYAVEVDSGTPLRYYLDFKSDSRLVELREALDRMDRGKFGVCLACGGPIDISLLKTSPGVQFCASCLETAHLSTGELSHPVHQRHEAAFPHHM